MTTLVRSPRKRTAENGETSPYKLRETSKLPSRYREEDSVFTSPKARKTPSKKTPKKLQNGKDSPNIFNNSIKDGSELETQSASSSRSENDNNDDTKVQAKRALTLSPMKGQLILKTRDIEVGREVNSDEKNIPDLTRLYPNAESANDIYNRESFFKMFSDGQERMAIERIFNRYESLSRQELGQIMRINLKKIFNILRYKKTRQWLQCEFFYSGVDEQIFFGENEFRSILKESFPNLKTFQLNKVEWRTIRRLLGKPRRCSATFFKEERMYLEDKRKRIRSVYDGTYLNYQDFDWKDIPSKLPKPLTVGNRVYARVRYPKDGIYPGTIDALLPDGYRVVFEQKDVPPSDVLDTEVILDGTPELLSIAYFIEQANSKLPSGVRPLVSAVRDVNRPNLLKEDLVARVSNAYNGPLEGRNDIRLTNKDSEMVGNFPIKFLLILMRLRKLVEIKKQLVKQLTDLNTDAELTNLHTSKYLPAFKAKYAQVVIDLEHVNQHIDTNLKGIQEHNMYFTSMNDTYNIGPDAIRKLCYQQAGRFVEHCNQGLNVDNTRSLKLIQSLTAILLQVRTIGTNKISALDLQSLNESVNSIRSQISQKNTSYFQDYVELHMKQFHSIMIENGELNTEGLR